MTDQSLIDKARFIADEFGGGFDSEETRQAHTTAIVQLVLAALAREQEEQPAPDVREILENYRCTHFCDEDGGLPLSDALAAAFGDKDVGRALEEIELIADALHGAAQPAAQEPKP